jgi:signal transduction histidine kinase
VVALLFAAGIAQRLELPLRDLLLRALSGGSAPGVAVVVIDDASLESVGRWPWPRATLARLVDSVSGAGARAVALDIALFERAEGDEGLAESLAAADSWLITALDSSGEWILPPSPLRESGRLAHAALELDHDGVLRRVASTKQSAGLSYPALSVAAASVIDPSLPIPVGRNLVPSFRIAPASVETISAASVLSGGSERLRDRVVFIGVSATALGDRVVTPPSRGLVRDPGVAVHAALAANLAQRATLVPLSPAASGLIAALILAAAGAIGGIGGAARTIASVGLIAAALAASPLLMLGSVELPMLTFAAVAIAGVSAVEIRSAIATHRSASHLAAALGEPSGSSGGPNEARIARLEEIAAGLAHGRREDADLRRVIAHELKTPLTSVRGLTQLLGGYELSDEERHRVAHIVNNETVRLQMMVERLLEIERVAVRTFEHDAAAVDLTELVRSRAAIVQESTTSPLALELAAAVHVRGDALLIERVVENLAANALKFSPHGSPVSIRLARSGAEAILEVEDRGRGVPPVERTLIFKRFSRGTGARSVEGLGLGLALVSEIVSWHRGTIEVTGGAGGGALFRVRLPLLEVRR